MSSPSPTERPSSPSPSDDESNSSDYLRKKVLKLIKDINSKPRVARRTWDQDLSDDESGSSPNPNSPEASPKADDKDMELGEGDKSGSQDQKHTSASADIQEHFHEHENGTLDLPMELDDGEIDYENVSISSDTLREVEEAENNIGALEQGQLPALPRPPTVIDFKPDDPATVWDQIGPGIKIGYKEAIGYLVGQLVIDPQSTYSTQMEMETHRTSTVIYSVMQGKVTFTTDQSTIENDNYAGTYGPISYIITPPQRRFTLANLSTDTEVKLVFIRPSSVPETTNTQM